MGFDQTENFVRGSANESVDSTQTTISVSDANEFPDPSNGYYNVVIWDSNNYPRPDQDSNVEILRVTGRDTSNHNITVSRGQENTAGASHPSGSAIQMGMTAKMIADAAPDDQNVENFSTSGASGTVPVSQGDGTLSMVSRGEGLGELARTPKWYARSQFDSLDGYLTDVNASDITLTENGVEMTSGHYTAEYARLHKAPTPTVVPVSWDTDRSFASAFHSITQGGKFHIGTGRVRTQDEDYTDRHVNFYLLDGSLYGSVGNGSSQTTSSELITYSDDESHRIRYEYEAGSQVDFYVDGTKQGSITTGLPSGTDLANWITLAGEDSSNETNRSGEIRVPEYRVVVYE